MRPVELIIFREIGKADVDSAKGEGAVVTTGGGQMDLRFNPYAAMEPAFRRALTGLPILHQGKSVLQGPVNWMDADGALQTETVEFWPPPQSRPTMGRINKLPHIKFFDRMRHPGFDAEKQYLFLMVKEVSGPAWMFLLDKQTVDNSHGWEPGIQQFLSRKWAATPASRKFVGYIDCINDKHVLGGADND